MIHRNFSGISKCLILFRKSGVSLISEGWRLDFSCRNLSKNSAFFSDSLLQSDTIGLPFGILYGMVQLSAGL